MIEYGDPQLFIEGTTVRMMREISLKIDQHIIDTLLRPAFEAGREKGWTEAASDYTDMDTGWAPDFDEWLDWLVRVGLWNRDDSE